MAEQNAFYFNQSRCSGCGACLVACKDWNDVKPGQARWRRLIRSEAGSFPNVKVYNLTMPCNHCASPVCETVCPVGAIFKREEDGVVIVNRNVCIACKQCLASCPFGSPQFGDDISEPVKDPNWKVDHPMQKCTMCWDRLADGKDPACVASCPQRALDFDRKEALEEKYDDHEFSVEGFPSDDRDPSGNRLKTPTNPSVLFKSK